MKVLFVHASLALLTCLTFAACGSNQDSASNSSDAPITQETIPVQTDLLGQKKPPAPLPTICDDFIAIRQEIDVSSPLTSDFPTSYNGSANIANLLTYKNLSETSDSPQLCTYSSSSGGTSVVIENNKGYTSCVINGRDIQCGSVALVCPETVLSKTIIHNGITNPILFEHSSGGMVRVAKFHSAGNTTRGPRCIYSVDYAVFTMIKQPVAAP